MFESRATSAAFEMKTREWPERQRRCMDSSRYRAEMTASHSAGYARDSPPKEPSSSQ